MPGQLPDGVPLGAVPVDGVVVVVDGVVAVVVGVVAVDVLDAALAIAAPPPPRTPAAPIVTSAIRNRFMGLHLLPVLGHSTE
jgi:hypothetical protein